MARPNGNVNCPVHGTHGVLSQGKCWYCVQSGMSTTPTPVSVKKKLAAPAAKPGTKRKIA